MKRRNGKEYLPLRWCRDFSDVLYGMCGDSFDPEKIRRLLMVRSSGEAERLLEDPALRNLVRCFTPAIMERRGAYGAFTENLFDMDCVSLACLWGRNKQAFRIDPDFARELAGTENVRILKDMFDFLPYKYVYLDFSESPEICRAIRGEGLFACVEKDCGGSWRIHSCKISDALFFGDVISLANEDAEIGTDVFMGPDEIETYGAGGFAGTVSVDMRLQRTLVLQTLMYLCSVEPDIRENPETKETYRKPSSALARPRDRFSELRAWDVGARYGAAFRKWKAEKEGCADGGTRGTQGRMRPHSKKAHWSHFWYGKKDGGERVRRPKWIAEYYVGLDGKSPDSLPAVIHRTAKARGEAERD